VETDKTQDQRVNKGGWSVAVVSYKFGDADFRRVSK
jgi:hypothetical protein